MAVLKLTAVLKEDQAALALTEYYQAARIYKRLRTRS
jgi:hypothetical protein